MPSPWTTVCRNQLSEDLFCSAFVHFHFPVASSPKLGVQVDFSLYYHPFCMIWFAPTIHPPQRGPAIRVVENIYFFSFLNLTFLFLFLPFFLNNNFCGWFHLTPYYHAPVTPPHPPPTLLEWSVQVTESVLAFHFYVGAASSPQILKFWSGTFLKLTPTLQDRPSLHRSPPSTKTFPYPLNWTFPPPGPSAVFSLYRC